MKAHKCLCNSQVNICKIICFINVVTNVCQLIRWFGWLKINYINIKCLHLHVCYHWRKKTNLSKFNWRLCYNAIKKITHFNCQKISKWLKINALINFFQNALIWLMMKNELIRSVEKKNVQDQVKIVLKTLWKMVSVFNHMKCQDE